MQAQYFRFFWPLALSSLLFASGSQFRNAALARYPDAARELSTYAFAFSAYVLLWASNNFVPQVANVYARSARGLRVALSTVSALNAGSGALLYLVATTHWGAQALSLAYGIDGAVLVDVRTYLAWLSPLLLLSGWVQFHDGLLIQVKKTHFVTLARLTQLVSMASALGLGLTRAWSAMATMLAAHYASSTLSLAFLVWATRRHFRLPESPEHAVVTHGEILRFMAPTTVTSVMFTATRPVLYAALSRTADPLVAVAGLRIAYDVLASLQMVANQFRHFFVTFGLREDMRGKRRFMASVCLGLTALMWLTLVPGAREIVFGTLLGTRGHVYEAAVSATAALMLMPVVLMSRNYFHALLLARRTPNGMAVGAMLRVALVATASFGLLALGYLNAFVAAVALGLGFVAELVISWLAWNRVADRP